MEVDMERAINHPLIIFCLEWFKCTVAASCAKTQNLFIANAVAVSLSDATTIPKVS